MFVRRLAVPSDLGFCPVSSNSVRGDSRFLSGKSGFHKRFWLAFILPRRRSVVYRLLLGLKNIPKHITIPFCRFFILSSVQIKFGGKQGFFVRCFDEAFLTGFGARRRRRLMSVTF
ncbi:unnamed protein product [Arabidopsis lyrata]|uniref:Uncharacterized protein n=1 Tax=Arabidopsis lyrata subsp. lyrata TaxID=81972 RepID=D7M9L5_ARALL|nr:hypothetical protein ARALYDRAFT_912528 [Arabidopsis lyrata subsp. lyrata]CAH8273944.1 unnamed protein product [Arabidopsis lyrata]